MLPRRILLNRFILIRDSLERDSNGTKANNLHSEKHLSVKISTEPGRITSASICDNLEPDSNLTEDGDCHLEKHSSLKTSIDVGMRISSNSLFVNANNSILSNFEAFSIATELICRMHSEVKDSICERSQSLTSKTSPGINR
jgi:hypothetical protein